MAVTSHPTPQRLLDFARGNLGGAEFEEIEQHVSDCDSCCKWMARQPDSTLLSLAREAATIGFTRPIADQTQLRVPEELANHPRYQVLEVLGSGGMGVVYKALHKRMNRHVALKVIRPAMLMNPQAVERFEREVQVAAKLHHPNIVVSYDADAAGELHFLVMEFVEGKSLDQRVAREGPFPVDRACELIRQAALGLAHAHAQGMVHRDLKPQNLMLTSQGDVKILDFGLSRIAEAAVEFPALTGAPLGSQTSAGVVLGTPDYIAPEQITSAAGADARADIYSLGCTLYFLLAGKPPFGQLSVAEKLQAHQTKPLPPLDVPPALSQVLARMAAKSPDDRFASSREVADALARMVGKKPVGVSRRSWLIAASLAGVAMVGGASTLAIGMRARKPKFLVLMPSKGLWLPDYEQLAAAAKQHGVDLVIASTTLKPAELLASSPKGVAMPDREINRELQGNDFAGVVVIGYETSEFLPGGVAADDTIRLLNDFQREKKVIGALCAGQRVLAQWGIAQGKRVARCEVPLTHELEAGGASETTNPVERDGNVITAGSASVSAEFLNALLAASSKAR